MSRLTVIDEAEVLGRGPIGDQAMLETEFIVRLAISGSRRRVIQSDAVREELRRDSLRRQEQLYQERLAMGVAHLCMRCGTLIGEERRKVQKHAVVGDCCLPKKN